MSYVTLTRINANASMPRRAIRVNMDNVQYYEQRTINDTLVRGSTLYFREPDSMLNVNESPEEIDALLYESD